MIKFGTDGWRGEIARDFTFENVQYVALATAAHLKKKYPKDKLKVVIGYDTRFLSAEFAAETARVLAANGVEVFLADAIASTPQISFHTKLKNAQLGVVITASHNPPKYNGFKIKGSFGGPAIPEEVEQLEAELHKLLKTKPVIKIDTLDSYIQAKRIHLFDTKPDYIKHLKDTIDFENIEAKNYKILYEPMYGAGINTIQDILPGATEIHGEYNPSFGDIDHPEPIDKMIGEAMSMMKEGDFDFGFATDGDADRVGAIDEEGNFVNSHQIFMILLKYLYEYKHERGSVGKTVSLSSMVDKYCNAKGIELFQTPVGFKHIAKLMIDPDKKIIIGGEESGGLGTSLHIPERDGMFNALLLLETMAIRNMSLKKLCDELDREFGTHRFDRRDVRVTPENKEEILSAAASKPKTLANLKVIDVDTTDGYKFFVEGGAWLLIRASGTEPLVRFYAEAQSMEKVNELLDAGQALK